MKKLRSELREKGAFSIIELAVSAGLVSLVGGMMLISMGPGRARAGAGSMAQALANELRQARQLAISSQSPVAVVFPSGAGAGGARPISTSFYQLEGFTAPTVTRSVDYKGDFPGCAVFNGSWSTDASTYANSGAPTNQANPAVAGHKFGALDLDKWLPTYAKQDYCIIFGPDGTVRSNDLPTFDYAYHLLVSSGVAAVNSAGTPPNTKLATQPAYFSPVRLGETQTVTIDVGGAITVSPGVRSVASGAVAVGGRSDNYQAAAPARGPSSAVAPAPATPTVAVLPATPDPAAGAAVTVGPDGYVTLECTVVDNANSGERLYCQWQVTPDPGNAGVSQTSAYSIPVQTGRGAAMDWDPSGNGGAGQWKSLWQWRPPVGGQPGDKFQLSVVVQNSAGAALTAAITRRVDVCPPGQVLYQQTTLGFAGASMAVMNPDGGGKHRLHFYPFSELNPVPANEGDATSTIDGERIAFLSSRPPTVGGTPLTSLQGFVGDRDGHHCFQLTNEVSSIQDPTISPLGNLVAYKMFDGTATRMFVINADPNPANRIRYEIVDLDLNGRGLSCYNGVVTDPAVRYAFDRIAWDSRVADSAYNNTLYYTCNRLGGGTEIRKVQVTLNPAGQPISATAPTTIESGPPARGARSPFFFTDLAGDSRLFFTADDSDSYSAFKVDGTGAAQFAVFSGGLKEDVPVPWMDGTNLRLFAVDVLSYAPTRCNIVRLTPPLSPTAATDRRRISYDCAATGILSLYPVYLPPRP